MFNKLKSMWDAFRAKLTTDASSWWKLWSVRLAAVWAIIVGVVFASPTTMLEVLNQMPSDLREKVSPLVTIFIFTMIVVTRLWNQQKGTDDGKKG